MFALQLFTLVSNLTCFLFGVHHMERVARRRCAIQTQDGGRFGRPDFFHALVTLVEHGFHTAVIRTGQHDVAHVQRSVGHEHRGHITTSFVQGRFDDGPRGLTVRVGFQVEHLGFEKHLLQQLVHADAFLGRNVLALVFSAPFLHEEVHLCQPFLNLVGIGRRLVYLVDGKHDGDIRRHGMVDGLLRLRHDVVVRRDDDDGDIRHLRTTGSHGREGFVPRRVKEGDVTSVFQRHVIGTDMLRDAAGLAGNDIGLADIVEQRGLSVIDMPHDRHDGGARHQIFLVVFLLVDGFRDFRTDIFRLETEFLGHKVDGLRVHALVDGHHDAHAHTSADDLSDRHVHHGRQLIGRHKFRQLQHLAFSGLLFELFLHRSPDTFAFLLAVFRALVRLVLARQPRQGLLHLFGYVFVGHFIPHGLLLAVLAFPMLSASGISAGRVIFLLTALLLHDSSHGVHIDTFLPNPHPLLFLAAAVRRSTLPASLAVTLLPVFLLAFLAFLFFRLLLGTRGLVQAFQVDMPFHFQLGHHCGIVVKAEHAILFRADGLLFRGCDRFRLFRHLFRILGRRVLDRFSHRRHGRCFLALCLRLHGHRLAPRIVKVYLAHYLRACLCPDFRGSLDGYRLFFRQCDGRLFLLVLPFAADDIRVVPQTFVLLKFRDKHLVLLVGNFGVGVGLHLLEAFFLQELDSRLQSHITFFGYFIQSYAHTRYYSSSNSSLKILNTSSTVSSSRSARETNISRGAFSTSLAVSIPMPFNASITHGSMSPANSSK